MSEVAPEKQRLSIEITLDRNVWPGVPDENQEPVRKRIAELVSIRAMFAFFRQYRVTSIDVVLSDSGDAVSATIEPRMLVESEAEEFHRVQAQDEIASKVLGWVAEARTEATGDDPKGRR